MDYYIMRNMEKQHNPQQVPNSQSHHILDFAYRFVQYTTNQKK